MADGPEPPDQAPEAAEGPPEAAGEPPERMPVVFTLAFDALTQEEFEEAWFSHAEAFSHLPEDSPVRDGHATAFIRQAALRMRDAVNAGAVNIFAADLLEEGSETARMLTGADDPVAEMRRLLRDRGWLPEPEPERAADPETTEDDDGE